MDALSYLREVKEHFKNDKAVYDVFLEIMKEFKARRCAPTHPHRTRPSLRIPHAPLTLALHVTPYHSIPHVHEPWDTGCPRLNPGVAALHIAIPELSPASVNGIFLRSHSHCINPAHRQAVG